MFERASLPSRGAWIEIPWARRCITGKRRSPHGERGLKSHVVEADGQEAACRSPHGERGLKWFLRIRLMVGLRRSPHGERGLKLMLLGSIGTSIDVAPLTGSVD